MKIKKKTAMITSFTLGLLMFATTAMAEISSKSGYDQAKDALKYSAESFTSKLSNYTIDISMNIKDNGKVIISENTVNKYDITKNSCENFYTRINGSKKSEGYFYRDKDIMVNTSENQDIYFVTEYEGSDEGRILRNPFEEKSAGDIEKIGDAIVGSLKDYVVVDEKTNGSKELSGSISEAQIPALVNAVTSYMIKSTSFFNIDTQEEKVMPMITKDVYVKEVKGNMVVDKDGLIQNIFGTGVLSGKDDKGNEHTLTFELLGKVSNINSTAVNKPDLSGKKVEKYIQENMNVLKNPEMYVGKYKNDIVIKEDGKFQKIGERIIDITHSDHKSIGGTYHEEYGEGYKDYAGNKSDISFDAKYREEGYYDAEFDIEGSSDKGYINLNIGEAKFHFGMPVGDRDWYNGEFTRVFE
ncbi:hypothetical protein U732_1807 [Clostridium argentinense CDC 2741]|uniref:Uncharacterized protein n=1 Tax=Clostridium argentinense CDC 2741 TaxID=1418104 RepID=A0A0C1UFQ6_9CLOT|nr:hypothetical protein [Clostridium argentinense]ARC85973.1 hypothetical protein RSJ17_16475 [Clostridium argentinense]KIE46245.1 hypothetical protein U732_1807 [Clostridium argentinense CDC 2741]NFF38906.1 hypothetical protein [Clostridium argentinense]NFP48698.1 hypothetical protein [Clostridium argentinense]NFP71034.1 hypothetical protein [Clostridium argentinense]